MFLRLAAPPLLADSSLPIGYRIVRTALVVLSSFFFLAAVMSLADAPDLCFLCCLGCEPCNLVPLVFISIFLKFQHVPHTPTPFLPSPFRIGLRIEFT